MDVEVEAGRELGGHRLLVRLGRGGMGEVWAAERIGPIGFSKLVALKLLPAPDLDANTAVMFLDEARIAGGLTHPAIVPTLDVGRDGALVWIAMELVRGPSLNLLLERLAARHTTMAPALVAHVGERIASAIDHAFHDARDGARRMAVVHRDVSPQNVLVDGTGRVLLSDFGIARSTVQSHHTAGGVFRGKPSYASPEQISGRALDDRSDLFSLGVVLWECATSRRLFGRKTADASADAVLTHVPKPLVALVPGFPEPLARVIDRMLAKDPGARYATAGDAARALADVSRTLSGGTGSTEALTALVRELARDVTDALDAKLDDARLQLADTRVR
ncbi:serine/threonine protein kinase, partial [Myxococcota bacterium]|nr:serine/threonine protein kinase [Myxococcota bacterium]